MPETSWGSRGVARTLDVGSFTCPDCGPSPYSRKLVRRWIVLFALPVVPVGSEEQVVCDRCRKAFAPDVLDTIAAPAAPEADRLRTAAFELMAAMVHADGVVLDAEITAVVQASRLLPGAPLSETEALELVALADPDRDPAQVLELLAELLGPEERETLFQVALGIAAADGTVSDEEKLLLTEIGEALGLDVTEGLADLFA